MAKADSRTAAGEAVGEVGREYVRAARRQAGGGAGTGMAGQAAPLGRRGEGEALRRSLQPRLRTGGVARRLGAGETATGGLVPPVLMASRASGSSGRVCSSSWTNFASR